MLAIGPGLLAGTSLCFASSGPAGNGRLGEPLGRWRHCHIVRFPAPLLLEIRDACSQRTVETLELDDPCLLRSNELGALLVRGRAINWEGIAGGNSPPYARCCPRWWMRRSGDLNSYGKTSGEHTDSRMLQNTQTT